MKIKYFLITAVLATAIFCSAGFVSAQATDNSALIAQLQAQIQSLMQQIQQLIAQQQGGQTWCYTFNTNMGVGYGGGDLNSSSSQKANDVRNLRTALINNGISEANNLSSGNSMSGGITFDEQYASAVVAFQEKYASTILTPNRLSHGTGFVGLSTRAKLNALYGCGTFPAPTATIVNGTCGSADGQTFTTTVPVTNLCYAGTASAVSIPQFVGGWYWTCTGLNGGSSTHCTAIIGSTLPSITVTPASGQVPLTVTAIFDGCIQELNWGDGTTHWYSGYAMQSCGAGIPVSQHPIVSPTHTYTSVGTYTITLGSTTKTVTVTSSTPTQPSITSISPNSATIGSLVTVIGMNLSGFEGDKNLWIENSTGQRGIIYGSSGSLVSTDTAIRFYLAGSYCASDTSYSGLPCPSYLAITPGAYNIYALPWSTMSNKMSINIVAP